MNIELNDGIITSIDDEDFDKVAQYKLCAYYKANAKKWYVTASYKGRIQMHRLITNAPSDKQVDHIDGNPLNNRKSNLRLCTASQNQRNRKAPGWGTSTFRGVCFEKRAGKWVAGIRTNKRRIEQRYFKGEIAAAFHYDKIAILHHGCFASPNFPESTLPDFL